MLVIYKFSKRVTLIKNKDTFITKRWVYVFLIRLNFINWGLPEELITKRDPKLLSKFWTSLFKNLVVKLLYNTIYHSQTDASSEKTN